MRLFVADREAGNIIEEVTSIEEGKELIKEYEFEDKEEGCYSKNFYGIVNEDGETVL